LTRQFGQSTYRYQLRKDTKMAASGESPPSQSVELRPRSDRFSPDHPNWTAQVNTLWEGLEDAAGTVRRELVPVPGQKGGGETIILALGSAGAISAMVEVIKAWLSRDRGRSLELTSLTDGQGRRTITVHGDQVSDATIREAVRGLIGSGDA
jgi:Effector Associated Constant Component 1